MVLDLQEQGLGVCLLLRGEVTLDLDVEHMLPFVVQVQVHLEFQLLVQAIWP